ncbi:unnamed protein product, partial [Callosobruchus maculatus]
MQYREDCRQKFIETGILTLPSIYIYEVLVHAKQFLHTNTNLSSNDYNSRNMGKLIIPYVRLTKSQKTLQIIAPKYFNKLPVEIKNLSFNSFKQT